MAELAGRAGQTGVAQLTGFLSPAEQTEAEICAKKAGVALYFWGGLEAAERRMAAFTQEDWQPEWPAACLRIAWRDKYGKPGHRDLLGAILALGIDRSNVGDIAVGDGEAHTFVLRRMAGYLEANLVRVGSVAVSAQVVETLTPIALDDGAPVRVTVSSVRLDAIIAATWNLARARAAEMVTAGRVQVDHCAETRPDRQIAEGAIVSIRGLGRAKLVQIGGKTKKNRISVTLARY